MMKPGGRGERDNDDDAAGKDHVTWFGSQPQASTEMTVVEVGYTAAMELEKVQDRYLATEDDRLRPDHLSSSIESSSRSSTVCEPH
nr:hypothetical protein CFP56_43793 [Quercus suber]